MPERLYRDDAYLIRFKARVTAAQPRDGGLVALEMDRTAFYPTGGGQPHDTGSIAGHAVVDVAEGGDGRILHMVRPSGGETPADSGEVEAGIDWPRRFDHMQQHTGQHILSRAFVEMAGAATRSFHLGETACSIDVDLAAPDETTVRRAEALANEIVFSDVRVLIESLDASRAGRIASDLDLARELALKPGDPIRIIRIGDFDETPCGGTHVRRSGEVGTVAVRAWERFKGGARVTFVCGGRVVRMARELGAVVDACVARLSAQPAELPTAVERLQEQLAEGRRTVRGLSEELAGAEAAALDASAREATGRRILVKVMAQRSGEDLQRLAQRYVEPGARVALLASTDSSTGKATLVFARSESGLPADLKMGEILAAVCRPRGGRGGGGAAMARGGGVPSADASSCLEEAFEAVRGRLES